MNKQRDLFNKMLVFGIVILFVDMSIVISTGHIVEDNNSYTRFLDVEDISEELFNLRFQLATSQLENKMRVSQVRRDLARIKTIMREKQAQ